MSQSVSDVLRIMRLAIGRRSEVDPDSTPDVLLGYINDFVTLKMPNDIKLFEQWSTMEITLTQGVDVYLFPSTTGAEDFVNLNNEVLCSLQAPVGSSVSWTRLQVYQDPGEFYGYWGVNNEDVLIEGFPTQVLYYDRQLVFRTIPNNTYKIYWYGYKRVGEYEGGEDTLQTDYWMRYIAYGAARDYARDYNISPERKANIDRTFTDERMLLATQTHVQITKQRCLPRF